jgi:hypothetical protein|tara:strand:- start:325 stop:591 length:267 start_codon:yes stop_codon:yes gene_type:complete
MIAIQKTNTKKDGKAVEVRLTGDEAFSLNPLNKFKDYRLANRFVSSVNRRQKLFGKRYFIAEAIVKKASIEQDKMTGLISELQEKFNG